MFWHRKISLRFQRLLLTCVLLLIYSLLVILFKRIIQIIFETKLRPHMFWHQNLSFVFKWLLLTCFEPKIKFWVGLEENIVLAFWDTKSTYFCSKMLDSTHFGAQSTISIFFELISKCSQVFTLKTPFWVPKFIVGLFWTHK